MYRIRGADQKEYGPVSGEQVLQWVQENRLNRYSLAQKEGEAAWKPLDQFPEFAEAVATPPPPLQGSGPSTPPLPPEANASFQTSETPDPRRAALTVRWPAMALMIMGAFGVFLSIGTLASKPRMMEFVVQVIENAQVHLPQDQMERIRSEASRGMGLADYANSAFTLILNVLVVIGGWKMLRLENWGLCLSAAIIVMLPCSCCCCIGIPIGIWAAMVLNQPQVKACFR